MTLKPLNVCLLGILQLKKGKNVITPSLGSFLVSCDVSFLEHQPFYPNPTLQGETTSEDSYWDPSVTLPISLPLTQPNPPELGASHEGRNECIREERNLGNGFSA